MIKQTEALKMAIEALDLYDYTGTQAESELYTKAIQACKEALKQELEQPKNGIELEWYCKGWDAAEKDLATQELVHTNGDRTMSMKDRNFTSEGNGYIQDNNFDFDAGLRIDGDFVNDERDQYTQMICNALNTTPPSREWVGLSDDEIDAIFPLGDDADVLDVAHAIEAKLKEKNI